MQIKVNGSALSEATEDDLMRVMVDTRLYLPSSFEIWLLDHLVSGAYRYADGTQFALGTPIVVSAPTGGMESSTLESIITGEITALETSYDRDGESYFIVRGYDIMHRLRRGRKTRTFLNSTDSNIVTKILTEAGFCKKSVASTSAQYPYVLQNHVSDLSFLQARARCSGYRLTVDAGGTLRYTKQSESLGNGATLTLGENLWQFRPSINAADVVGSTVATSWGSETTSTRQLTGNATVNATGLPSGLSSKFSTAKSAFGGTAKASTILALNASSDATAVATALAERVRAKFVRAEGTCLGDAKVNAGLKITVKNAGTSYSGQYVVTATTHSFDAGGTYETEFLVSSSAEDTLMSLLDEGTRDDELIPGRMDTVVTGMVTANENDPNNLGRVKVKFPWLGKANGADVESTWCRLATPFAGAQSGMLFLPEVNDEVLVAFEQGDVNRPYVLGSLWSNTNQPPLANNVAAAQGKVNKRVIKSRVGHQIILDDTQGAEKITVIDKTNKNSIEIDASQNSITIKANGPINLTSASGDVSIECNNFSVKAKSNCTLEGGTTAKFSSKGALNMESTGNMAIKSKAPMNMESMGPMSIKSNGPMTVQGLPTVNVNSGALEVM